MDLQGDHAKKKETNLLLREEDKQTTYLVSDVKNVCATPALPAGQIRQMAHVPHWFIIDSLKLVVELFS